MSTIHSASSVVQLKAKGRIVNDNEENCKEIVILDEKRLLLFTDKFTFNYLPSLVAEEIGP